MARRPTDQDALFPAAPARRGRVELAVSKAIAAAQRDKTVSSALDAGAAALARSLARQADLSAAARDPWALARISGELRAVLSSLRLDPVARGALKRDEFAELIAALARPTAAPVGDEPDQ